MFKCPEESFFVLTGIEGVKQAPYFAKRQWVCVPRETDLSDAELETYLRRPTGLLQRASRRNFVRNWVSLSNEQSDRDRAEGDFLVHVGPAEPRSSLGIDSINQKDNDYAEHRTCTAFWQPAQKKSIARSSRQTRSPNGFHLTDLPALCIIWNQKSVALKMLFRNFTTGKSHAFGGEYVELVEGERLRYTDTFDDPNLPGEMQVTVTLNKVSVGTELDITQAGVPDLIPPEACYLGWQESLRNLARPVEPEINQ